jgi:hypothetical protein
MSSDIWRQSRSHSHLFGLNNLLDSFRRNICLQVGTDIFIVADGQSPPGAEIILADIETCVGVVHVIDAMLLPGAVALASSWPNAYYYVTVSECLKCGMWCIAAVPCLSGLQ